MRQSSVLANLRAQIAQIEGVGVRHAMLPFGIEAVDRCLPGGGIATGALHEFAGSRERAQACKRDEQQRKGSHDGSSFGQSADS